MAGHVKGDVIGFGLGFCPRRKRKDGRGDSSFGGSIRQHVLLGSLHPVSLRPLYPGPKT